MWVGGMVLLSISLCRKYAADFFLAVAVGRNKDG